MSYDAATFLQSLFRQPSAVATPARSVAVAPDDLPADWWLEWDERAAVMEYHGGMSRDRAEALALKYILRRMGETESDLRDEGAVDHE